MQIINDYSTLFFHNPFSIWVYELESYKILDVNQAAINHYGYNKDEFLSMTIFDLRPKEEIPVVLAAHDTIRSNQGNILFGTFTHKKKNGQLIRMEVNGHRVYFQEKSCLMVVCQDVTLKEQKLKELHASVEKLNMASDIADIGYWKLDLESKIFECSDKLFEILGKFPTKEPQNIDHLLNMIHPEDRELFIENYTTANRDKKSFDLSYRILLSDNTIKWIHQLGRFKKNIDGNYISFEGTIQNITLQKTEEQHLKLLNSVVTNSNDTVIIAEAEPFTEPGPYIVYVNNAFTDMTGYSSDEVIGRSPRILHGPETDQQELLKLENAIKKWKPCKITIKNYKKNGDEFWNSISVFPVADTKGKYTHWISIERDVSETKNEQIRNNLLSKVSLSFSKHKKLNTSLNKLCQLLSEFGNFSFCEIWLPDIDTNTLWLASKYEADNIAKSFYKKAKNIRSFRLGEGLPGAVWKMKQTMVWDTVEKEYLFIRKDAAKIAGLKSVLGIHLHDRSQTVGVAVIGTSLNAKGLKKHEEILKKLESLIGAEIGRKKSEEALEKAFEEKNTILESIGDAFFAVNNSWVITYWNQKAETILGQKKENIIGKNLWEEYPEASDSAFFREYHKVMKQGKPSYFEEFYPPLKKWFEVSVYPNPEGLSVYFKDITSKKEAVLQIQQANERFEMVTKATTDAIWDWDIKNDLFYRAEGFKKLYGKNVRAHLSGTDIWEEKFHPEDLPLIKQSLFDALKDRETEFWQREYRVYHETGEEKTVIDKGIIIRNELGEAVRMIGAISNISDRVRYKKELEELNITLKKNIKELEVTNEQLEQFAYIASHDLQEPLRMISSFLNLLEAKVGDQLDNKARQYIYFATDGAKRMKQIILDLLEYSRAGKFNEEPQIVDLNLLLEDYRILRRKIIGEKNVTMVSDILPVIKCHKAPLIQTIHCLMDNSIKYSRESVNPYISISVEEGYDFWTLIIQDNGIGIEKQFFEKIFIIFQRLHDKDQYSGTGIGLAIAKKNIESWGGKIWLDSNPGKGSTFYFTIKKM